MVSYLSFLSRKTSVPLLTDARVAQWIEQRFPKPLVAGSIPVPGTTFELKTLLFLRFIKIFIFDNTFPPD